MSKGKRNVGITLASLAGVAAGFIAYGSMVERKRYTLRQVTVPCLPVGSRGVSALHISDLHITPAQHDKVEWLRSLAMFHPDFIIDTGDNVGRADALPTLFEALEPLFEIPGVYVDGSNDHHGPQLGNPFTYLLGDNTSRDYSRVAREPIDVAAMHARFDSAGWKNLNNLSARLTVGGLRLGFVGTGDAHTEQDDLFSVPTNMPKKSQRVDALIGVTHAPYRRVLNTFVANGVDAIFAGHTHGGQVRVPGYGALTTNCDLPASQASGLSQWSFGERTVPLHVSAGLGTSIYAPVRFACPPEATLINLVPVRG